MDIMAEGNETSDNMPEGNWTPEIMSEENETPEIMSEENETPDIMAEGNETMDIMALRNETLEIKFRIFDGTDIGHGTYSYSVTAATILQKLFSEWPQDKSIVPQSANDMKLIHGGRVLNNEKTLAESRVHLGDLTDGVITMHVVVQRSNAIRGRNQPEKKNQIGCACTIL